MVQICYVALIYSVEAEELRKAVSKLPADGMELIIMVYYSKIFLKTYVKKKGIGYLQVYVKRTEYEKS